MNNEQLAGAWGLIAFAVVPQDFISQLIKNKKMKTLTKTLCAIALIIMTMGVVQSFATHESGEQYKNLSTDTLRCVGGKVEIDNESFASDSLLDSLVSDSSIYSVCVLLHCDSVEVRYFIKNK